MKKSILLIAIVLTVLFAAIGSVGSVSVAANREDSSHGRSQHCYWTKDSFATNNRKGNLYATIITLKIPPKESSKSSEDISGSNTDAADQG